MDEIRRKIAEADMVLVTIGDEFERIDSLRQDTAYQKVCNDIAVREAQWAYPFVSHFFLEKDAQLKDAYQAIQKLLEGKNYYVISAPVNGMIMESGIRQDRVVEPCGTCYRMQCSKGCEGSIRQTEPALFGEFASYIRGDKSWEELQLPVCDTCHVKMECNSLYAEHYLEEGYCKDWERYTKWLQGTVNRRLCVLELGVGMQYAGLLRFPMEKIVGINRKAELIRIHHQLSQLPLEIGGRGMGIPCNAVEYMAQTWKSMI